MMGCAVPLDGAKLATDGSWWLYDPRATIESNAAAVARPPASMTSGRWVRLPDVRRYEGDGNRHARRKAAALRRRRP